MPYIKDENRAKFDAIINVRPTNAGELNYVITSLAVQYMHDTGLNYSKINEVMGVFACAQQEFYRRVAAPYEDTKVEQNGDVFK